MGTQGALSKPRNVAVPGYREDELPHGVAQESDFWKFLGAVAIPIASLAVLALFVDSGLRLTDYHDLIRRSAESEWVFDSLDERRDVVPNAVYRQLPTVIEPPPAEQFPVEPLPVAPPVAAPSDLVPLVTAERQPRPGRVEPVPLPPDQAEVTPFDLDEVEPAAGPPRALRDLAAVPPAASSAVQTPMPERLAPEPLAPEPLAPERLAPEPFSEPRPIEPPALPAPRPAVPVATRPGPAQPVSPQPVSPQPEQPVAVAREPAPAEAAPEPSAVVLPATPAPLSGTSEAETPEVAMLPPGQPARLEQLLPPGRGSGHRLLARLPATESSQDCDNRQLPFFRVLESNVEPERLQPGGRFSHRVVYALCPADPTARLTAIVIRQLRGSAGSVLVQETDNLQLRPGTWASDEELAVPADTAPGRYRVTMTMTFGGRAWTEETDLLIE